MKVTFSIIKQTVKLHLFIFLLFHLGGCKTDQRIGTDVEDILTNFKNPPVEYSTAPFWVWHDDVTREKIDFQLEEYADKGIYQAIIHARSGLITEYLSDDWFELCQYAVTKAEELNMKIWLYDENPFPSGFAGGHVPASLPTDADRVAGLKLHRLNILNEADKNRYIIVLKKVGDSFANISKGLANYLNEPGEYYAFEKWYFPENDGHYGGFSYVDLLAYGITERFIRITMKGYEEYLKDKFGNTIPGIFTDEPHINTTDDSTVIKYTPVLFNRFQEVYGYPLENYLPCLYEEVSDWKNVRHDYYALLLDMFIERWAKPWFHYTDTNNLNWTGHYWDHAWPNPGYGPDNMAMYAWHQVPGIDLLFNNEKLRSDQFGNIRIVKELGSVANQLGKPRTLSETYGASGWELDFEDMKRLGDWEYALGVNLMNQHLTYMTLKGARKRDFPQSMSYHAPWWNNYKILNEYFHRLSYILSSGEQRNKILVLEPTTTTWMYFSPNGLEDYEAIRGRLAESEKSFRNLLVKLEKHQVEYDLGSERIITDHGSIDKGKFMIGERKYDLIILPPYFENLEKSTYELLVEYLKNGGKIISLSGFPTFLDGNISRKMQQTFQAFEDQWTMLNELNTDHLKDNLDREIFIPVEPENWGGRVFHHRRSHDNGEFIFLSNFDTIQNADIEFKIEGKTALDLDLLTGEIFQYETPSSGEFLTIKLKLLPAESRLFFVSDTRQKYPFKNEPDSWQMIGPAGDLAISRNGLNALAIDYCDLSVNGRNFDNIYFYNAADTVYKEYRNKIYAFNYNPWSVGTQYKTNILDDNNTFDENTGFEVKYRFRLAENFVPEEIKAVIEWAHLYDMSINGNEIQPDKDSWWLDKDFGAVDISDFVKPGQNILSLSLSPMNVLAEIEPVYLIGEFGVLPDKNGWIIHKDTDYKLGSWKDMGLPFYSESVSYTREIEIDNTDDVEFKIQLNKWSGTVAEVIINDEQVGIIAWPPYECHITDFIKPGINSIEVKVFGSLKNLLGPHHNNPERGFVTPWSFFYAPSKQPPGEEYDQFNYGLFEDFRILKAIR